MGIIVLIVSVAVCVSLTIQQAARNAKEDTIDGMTITAKISVDRAALMQNSQSDGTFDKSSFHSQMGSGLTLEEMLTYAEADSVKSFYYSANLSVNGNDELEPVSDTESTESTDSAESTEAETAAQPAQGSDDRAAGKGQMMGMSSSDFKLIGYSSDEAMTAFVNGTSTVTEGSVFEEGTSDMQCIISEELSLYNSIAVGDTITVTNSDAETEEYVLTVVGIYTAAEQESMSFSQSDPANQILVSYESLASIISASAENATTVTNETTGEEESTAMTASTSGTYVFADTESYEKFEDEARALGLDEMYTVSSTDYSNYEESLVPLETLSKLSKYFLIVVLVIGIAILMVFNMFSTRERKYEIGVLTAIGMKKSKVAMQFMAEICAITVIAVAIGLDVGSAASVPVANSLLESQVEAEQSEAEDTQQSFGRGMGGMKGGMTEISSQETSYISEISSSVDLVVLIEVLGICILVSLIAGVVSVSSIMKYEPLTILAGRD